MSAAEVAATCDDIIAGLNRPPAKPLPGQLTIDGEPQVVGTMFDAYGVDHQIGWGAGVGGDDGA